MAFTEYQNALLAHTHNIENLECRGSLDLKSIKLYLGDTASVYSSHTVCGWGLGNKFIGWITTHAAGELTNAKFTGSDLQYTDAALDVESKPVHNLMPIMVFIGRQNG